MPKFICIHTWLLTVCYSEKHTNYVNSYDRKYYRIIYNKNSIDQVKKAGVSIRLIDFEVMSMEIYGSLRSANVDI